MAGDAPGIVPAKIHEHVKFARAIDDNGIRIAVTVQIGPGKSVHP